MSQSSGSSSSTAKGERIIPIQIEGDESKIVTSTTLNLRSLSRRAASKSEEPQITKQPTDSETTNSVNEELSDSEDENNVAVSIKALSLSSEKQKSHTSDYNSSSETVAVVPQRMLPSYNVPEKIIIVLDRATDDGCTDFEIASGKKYPPLFMLQHAVKLFLHNKSCIDNRHEFALIYLNDNSATWVHDFTNSPNDIIRTIQSASTCEPEDIFNLNTVFDLIQKNVHIEKEKDSNIPPICVLRTVLLYGRSYSIPQLTKTYDIEKLLNSPYFTVDVVMTHEAPSSANHCTRIFKALQEIDTKGFAYSFSVSRNASDLHLAMGKILSHPLQRPHQLAGKYDINMFKQ